MLQCTIEKHQSKLTVYIPEILATLNTRFKLKTNEFDRCGTMESAFAFKSLAYFECDHFEFSYCVVYVLCSTRRRSRYKIGRAHV